MADGIPLAPVAPVAEDADARKARAVLVDQPGGIIVAAVVDDDDLPAPGALGQEPGDRIEGGDDALLLVEGRDDDGEIHGCGRGVVGLH